MTAPALRAARLHRARGEAIATLCATLPALAAGMGGGLGAMPAAAAVGASVALVNDDVFRGRSLSAGRPVGTLDLSYDDASGAYAGASVAGVAARHEGARLFAVQEYAGYARRLNPGLTLDLGVINSNYTSYASGGRSTGYTELYAGLGTNHLSGRIGASPDYFRGGAYTLYGELNGSIGRAAGWHLIVHGGLLRWLNDRKPRGSPVTHYDWQVGIARRFGRFGAHFGWAAGGPNEDFYAGRARGHGAIVAGADFAF
jgi:uncharacterized protein (TIGR02001 family)